MMNSSLQRPAYHRHLIVGIMGTVRHMIWIPIVTFALAGVLILGAGAALIAAVLLGHGSAANQAAAFGAQVSNVFVSRTDALHALEATAISFFAWKTIRSWRSTQTTEQQAPRGASRRSVRAS